MKKKRSKERDHTLEELERAVALLERLKGTSPQLDALYEQGKALLAEERESEAQIKAAKRNLDEATKKLDVAAREMMAKYGRKTLEEMVAFLARAGETETAESLRGMIDHADKIAKRDRQKKKRG